jgi:hypothetical protein
MAELFQVAVEARVGGSREGANGHRRRDQAHVHAGLFLGSQVGDVLVEPRRRDHLAHGEDQDAEEEQEGVEEEGEPQNSHAGGGHDEAEDDRRQGLEAFADARHEELEEKDDVPGVGDALARDSPDSGVLVLMGDEIDGAAEDRVQLLVEQGRVQVRVHVDGQDVVESPEGYPEHDAHENEEGRESHVRQHGKGFFHVFPERPFGHGPFRFLVEDEGDDEHENDTHGGRRIGQPPADHAQRGEDEGAERSAHVDHGVEDPEADRLVGLVRGEPHRPGRQRLEQRSRRAQQNQDQGDPDQVLDEDEEDEGRQIEHVGDEQHPLESVPVAQKPGEDRQAVGEEKQDELQVAEIGLGKAQARQVDAETEVEPVIDVSLEHLDRVGDPEDLRERRSLVHAMLLACGRTPYPIFPTKAHSSSVVRGRESTGAPGRCTVSSP